MYVITNWNGHLRIRIEHSMGHYNDMFKYVTSSEKLLNHVSGITTYVGC